MEPTSTTQEQQSDSERIEEKSQEPSEGTVSVSSRQPSTLNSGELRRRHRGSISKEGESSATIEKEKNVEEGGFYECNICFDTATNAVLTLCGHLFCWPCLHQWLASQPQNPLCPVCKAGCGKDKVIPVYGRGKEAKDPRQEAIPSRPAGQRPAPLRDPNTPRQTGLTHIGGVPLFSNSNVQVSLGGFGLFPGMFGVQFSFPSGPNHIGQNGAGNQQAFMSRMALMCALLVLVAIVFS